jgi:RNA-directed DNA polymerase
MDASNCDVASTNWTHWHGIPWQDAHQVVGRLQARIAKAAKAGEWRNVKCLQRLLTRSISAKALAVKRVTERTGVARPQGSTGRHGVLRTISGRRSAPCITRATSRSR